MFGYGYYPMVHSGIPAPPVVPGAQQPVLTPTPAIVAPTTHPAAVAAAPVMVIERDARHHRSNDRKKKDHHKHRHYRRRGHPRDGRGTIGGRNERLLVPQPGGVGELVSKKEYDKYYKKFLHHQQQQQTQQQMQYMQSYIQSLQAYIQQQHACNQNYASRTVINAPLGGVGGGGGGGKDSEDRQQNRLSRENKNYLVAWAREHAKKWLGPISPEVLDFYTVDKAAMRKFEVFLQNGGRKVLDMASQYLGQRFVTPRELVFAVTNLIHSQGPNYVNQLMDYLGCEFSYYLDPEDENGVLAQAGKREWRRAYYAQHGQCPSLREEQERDAILLTRTAGRPSRYANPPRSIGYNQRGTRGGHGGYDKNDAYDDDGDGGNFVTVQTGGNKIQIRQQNGGGVDNNNNNNNNNNNINDINHQQSQLKPHLRLQFHNGGGGARHPNMKVIADVANNNNRHQETGGKRMDRQPLPLSPGLAVPPPPPMVPPTIAKSSSLGYPFASSDVDGGNGVTAENLFAVSLGKPGPMLCPFDD